MSRTYRVGMIGCGGRAKEHVPGLKADGRCQVVAIADIKREAAEAMNKENDFGATIYTDYHAMLKNENLDVVVSCLWTGLHLPVYRDCANAGVKAVLSEKPMAATWGDCLEIARIAEETGCQLTFCHQRRFAAGNQLAAKLIAEGRFGKVERMDLYAPPNILDCGTHTFDQAFSFIGEEPVKWILGAVDVTKLHHWFGISSEGIAIGQMVFQNGIRASIQFGAPDLDMWTGVRVIGSDGFIEVSWDGEFGRTVVYSDPSWKVETVKDAEGAHMMAVVKNAIDALETGTEPLLSHKKALRASEVIFAFYESVRRHARVELPLTGVLDSPFLTMLENGEFPGHPAK